jgi:CheY-like chemotaxis protein
MIEKPNEDSRFEVELPLAAQEQARTAAAAANAPEPGRQFTILVIEAEEATQRQMLGLLESRGCRVIPVTNSDSGLELAQRMRFDIAFCSVHAPGLNWVELSERLQSRVGAFVLISGRYDPELVADFEEDGRYVISKPVQEGEIDRVLANAERLISAKTRA